MTDTEMEIIKMEYEHQETLCSEITSNKQFVGGMASIAAFVAIEWIKTKPHIVFVVPVALALIIAASLFIAICVSQDYGFPGEIQEWRERKRQYAKDLKKAAEVDISDVWLKDEFYKRIESTATSNSYLAKRKQAMVEWAGVLSAATITAIILETVIRYVFFSQAS